MGPGGSESSHGQYSHNTHTDAPRLTASTDRYRYRNQVRTWMRRVRVFAKGGDTRAKGVASGFAYALYASMDDAYQKVIDSKLKDAAIHEEPDDDDDIVLPYMVQKALVERILKIVAKDSSTEAARRLIQFNRRVFNCKRSKGETYETFASRFHAVAQDFFNCLQHSPTPQEEQNIALILLENANLQDSVYTNILSMLMGKQPVTADSDERMSHINRKEIKELKEHVFGIQSSASGHSIESQQLPISADKALATIKVLEARMTQSNSNEQLAIRFTLDDVLEALNNVKCSTDISKKNEQSNDKTSEPQDAREIIESLLSDKAGKQSSDRKGYIPPGTGAKRNSCCAACGKKGHWARDRQCELYNENSKGREFEKGSGYEEAHKKRFRNDFNHNKHSDRSEDERTGKKRRPYFDN